MVLGVLVPTPAAHRALAGAGRTLIAAAVVAVAQALLTRVLVLHVPVPAAREWRAVLVVVRVAAAPVDLTRVLGEGVARAWGVP